MADEPASPDIQVWAKLAAHSMTISVLLAALRDKTAEKAIVDLAIKSAIDAVRESVHSFEYKNSQDFLRMYLQEIEALEGRRVKLSKIIEQNIPTGESSNDPKTEAPEAPVG